MIIVRILGGLGNQMFQYAAGLSLAHQHGVALKLDITSFSSYPLRKFALDGFDADIKAASRREIEERKYCSEGIWKKVFRPFLKGKRPYSDTVYKEPSFKYDQSFFELPDNAYLMGSFQSERYFSNIASTIVTSFKNKAPLLELNKEYAQKMSKDNSVSVHVRRGDYVTNPHTNAFHGICDPDYYKQAIKVIEKHVASPVFYFFSDDIDWVKANLQTNHPAFYVDNNGSDCAQDLRLMSFCKHNIIANSSFSWWGAWLNDNTDKIVIAPQRWFASDELETQDLIPSTWLRV
jgi:hypothetical protein